MAKFPEDEWVGALMVKLNADQKYAQVARNWEGDLIFRVDPGGNLKRTVNFYLDLWHGKCRGVEIMQSEADKKALLILQAPYGNYIKLLKGDMDPMQALLTRKIAVKGNMAILMKSVPTVLDFVRCCREITDSFV